MKTSVSRAIAGPETLDVPRWTGVLDGVLLSNCKARLAGVGARCQLRVPLSPVVADEFRSSSSGVASNTMTSPGSSILLPVQASRAPLGLNARQLNPPVVRLNTSVSWPVSASQILTVRSPPAVAIREPTGLNAKKCTPPECPRRLRTSSPVAESHSLTVELLPPAVARREPSGLKTTPVIPPVGSNNLSTSLADAASHTLAVPSQLAEAINDPSGENATPATPSVWPS